MSKKPTAKSSKSSTARKQPPAKRAPAKQPAAKKATGKKKASGRKAPPPPKGWVELDMFKPAPPPAAAEPTVEEQVQEFITEEVAAGYFDDATITKLAADLYCDLTAKAKLKKMAAPMLAAARAAHKLEQRDWPKVTDNTRLDLAFADLEAQGILARQNYWCCSNCGGVAITEEVERGIKRGKKLRGYTFFHEQDSDMAVFGHGLHLDYGGPHLDDAGSVDIGKVVVKALRKQGLKPAWSGDLDTRIHIPMKWQRKFVKQVKYTPA